jgi:ABC-type nitrate/sulfonate/bicarbonate transport system permease component
MKGRTAKYVLGTASIATLLGLWWFVTARGLISPFLLPSPAAVLDGIRRIGEGYMGSSLWVHLRASLSVVLTGYAAAILIGVPLGAMMAWFRPVNVLFGPLVDMLRPIPPPAWIPLAILWFGIGLSGKTFVVFVSALTPCLISAYVAIREVPPHLMSAARMLGASETGLLFRVAIPNGLPVIVGGLRIALGNAWATVVAAELVVASAGFGYLIMSGFRNFESNIMAVGMIAIAIVGVIMNALFLEIEKRVIPWSTHHE